MPSKAHQPHRAGPLRTHSRSSSGGSSRIGLNLQFTAKDPPKTADKHKKTGLANETQRTHSPHPRVPRISSTSRVQSKETIQYHQPKRSQAPAQKKTGLSGKADFTLSASVGTDEDGWVSSESGAVTPANAPDEEEESHINPQILEAQLDTIIGTTPRPSTPLVRIETARPSQLGRTAVSRTEPSSPVQTATLPPSGSDKPKGDSRSENHVKLYNTDQPQPLSRPRSNIQDSLSRRSSTYSDYIPEGPPHPLIRQTLSRGHSFQGVIKPAALAPLTVNSESAQAQISSSPPISARTRNSNSPTMLFSPSQTQSPAFGNSQYTRSSRRTSISSSHSVQNLPAITSLRASPGSRTPRDRMRTLSTMSTTSAASLAALSSLTGLPAASRPGSPPLVAHFPDTELTDEDIQRPHRLVPLGYVNNHMSVLAHYSPLAESYNRVLRTKPRR